MIEDIRDNKNIAVYLKQLIEIKARIDYIDNYTNANKDRFVVETHALQIRKIIELIAFSLVAIHRTI
jgi:hypothetical protein